MSICKPYEGQPLVESNTQMPIRLRATMLVLLLALVVGFYLFNQIIPTYADDLCRRTPQFDLTEIFNDVYQMYFNWTGRSPVMLLNRLIFSSGQIGILFFNLVNSVMLGVACYYALQYTALKNPAQLSAGLLATSLGIFVWLLWFTPDVFAEALLWKTGAIQYFWSCIITLIALDPLLGSNRTGLKRAYLPLYYVLCLSGGTWLENLSLAVIPVWLLLLGAHFKTGLIGNVRLKQSAWGLFCWCLGTGFLFAAPGNYVRANAMHTGYHWTDQVTATWSRLIDIADPLTLLVYLLFLGILYYNRPIDWKLRIYSSLVFLLVALFSILVMIGAPIDSFVRRVGFPSEFFFIMATLCLFPREIFCQPGSRNLIIQRRAVMIVTLILASSVLIDALVVHQNYRSIWQQQQLRENWILAARSAERPLVEFLPLYFNDGRSTLDGQVNSGRYFARDITTDPEHWKNRCFARAYQLPAVVLIAKP